MQHYRPSIEVVYRSTVYLYMNLYIKCSVRVCVGMTLLYEFLIYGVEWKLGFFNHIRHRKFQGGGGAKVWPMSEVKNLF